MEEILFNKLFPGDANITNHYHKQTLFLNNFYRSPYSALVYVNAPQTNTLKPSTSVTQQADCSSNQQKYI